MERGVLQELFSPVEQNTFRSDTLFIYLRVAQLDLELVLS